MADPMPREIYPCNANKINYNRKNLSTWYDERSCQRFAGVG